VVPCDLSLITIRAGFKGGQTGQLPRASTTRGASQNSKKLLLKKHKKYFLKLIIWNKNMMSHYSFNSL